VKTLGIPLNTLVGTPAAVGTETSNLRRNSDQRLSLVLSSSRSTVVLTCHYGTSSLILEATPFANA
jgi:hypothetical protein